MSFLMTQWHITKFMPHNGFFFANRLNEGLKSISLNFTGENWVDFFWHGPKPILRNFTGTKSTFYPKMKYKKLAQ
jgi:hypothetical protein